MPSLSAETGLCISTGHLGRNKVHSSSVTILDFGTSASFVLGPNHMGWLVRTSSEKCAKNLRHVIRLNRSTFNHIYQI